MGSAEQANAVRALLDGDPQQSLAHSRNTVATARRAGYDFMELVGLTLAAYAAELAADPDAVDAYREALTRSRDLQNVAGGIVWDLLAALADRWARTGDTPAAAVLAGFLDTHHHNHTLPGAAATQARVLDHVRKQPGTEASLAEGAVMHRDQLAAFALQHLQAAT